MAAESSLQQRTQRLDHELGIERMHGAQPWFVNCSGGAADGLGDLSAALRVADAAEDAGKFARVLQSRARSGNDQPTVGQ
jgi:hypothetical protein